MQGRRLASAMTGIGCGFVVAFALAWVPARAGSGPAENPLDPPDTSSPRATLTSFLGRMEEFHRIARETAAAPGSRRARLLPRARMLLTCFDARELAPSIAEAQCFEAAVLLKEIFDRVPPTALDQVPDADMAREEAIERYRVPGTEITLVKVEDGPSKGAYLFSDETINRAPEFFERAREMPYRDDATTRGLYDLYIGLQGNLVPREWIEDLPEWATFRVHDHAIWQWISLVVFSLAGLVLVVGSYWIGRPRPDRGRGRRGWRGFLLPITWVAVAVLLDFVFSRQIRMTGEALIALKMIFRLQLFLAGIAAVLVVVNQVAELVIRFQKLRPEGIDSQLVRLGFRILTFLLVAWLVVLGADAMGIAVAPLIAGLGVSGLAVALAAQHTIENLIAGIVLFADKPVRVGDFCQFGDHRGTVEEIGLRSTRVRGLDRTVIAIPNAEFAKLQLLNLSRRDRTLLRTVLQLRYETTADQLRYVLAELRTLLLGHTSIDGESVRVRFVGYGAYSLDVEVFALVMTSSWLDYLGAQEDVLLRIMDLVRDAGTGFAFPAQTEYEAKDVGVDPQRSRLAEEKVRSWRERGQMAEAGFVEGSGGALSRIDPPSRTAVSRPHDVITTAHAAQEGLGIAKGRQPALGG